MNRKQMCNNVKFILCNIVPQPENAVTNAFIGGEVPVEPKAVQQNQSLPYTLVKAFKKTVWFKMHLVTCSHWDLLSCNTCYDAAHL